MSELNCRASYNIGQLISEGCSSAEVNVCECVPQVPQCGNECVCVGGQSENEGTPGLNWTPGLPSWSSEGRDTGRDTQEPGVPPGKADSKAGSST